MAFVFIKNNKGGNHLVYNGYIFRHEKKEVNFDGILKYWRCTSYDTIRCSARLTLESKSKVKETNGFHNHSAKPTQRMAKEIRQEMLKKARVTSEVPQRVLASIFTEIPEEVVGALPSTDSLTREIRKERQNCGRAPPNPLSRAELLIPKEYTKINDENFLLYDSGQEEDRILVFGTEKNLELLKESNAFFVDGTFSVCPLIFSQLYTIHGFNEDVSLPSIFALLPNKKFETYKRLISILQNLQPQIGSKLKTVMMDFEKSAINAFAEAFPEVRITGCFFHFKQCIWRKIQQIAGFQERYNNKEDLTFQTKIKKLAALAFLPVDEVITAYEKLCDTEFLDDDFSPLLDYIDDTWIGRILRGNRRREPSFAIQIWNQNQNVKDSLERTNNSVEGWHNSFRLLLGSSHPTIWKVIETFKKQQYLTEFKLVQYARGDKKIQKQKYARVTKSIFNLVSNYDSSDAQKFISGIVHNFDY